MKIKRFTLLLAALMLTFLLAACDNQAPAPSGPIIGTRPTATPTVCAQCPFPSATPTSTPTVTPGLQLTAVPLFSPTPTPCLQCPLPTPTP
jgi:hypothetical protein